MSEIRIPAAALEAGARAIEKSLKTARITLESEDGYKPEARAAFLAMLAAWPGKDIVGYGPPFYGIDLILPLPQEASDE